MAEPITAGIPQTWGNPRPRGPMRVPGRNPRGMGEIIEEENPYGGGGDVMPGDVGPGNNFNVSPIAGTPPPDPNAATDEDAEWERKKKRRQKLAKYYGPGGPGYVAAGTTPSLADAPAAQTGVWKAFWDKVNARRAAAPPGQAAP